MRSLMAALVLFTATLLMGMGNMGGTPEGTVPKTDENISVQLIDRSGVSTELTRFSLNGNVFIEGRRGDGMMSVHFHDLQEVSFGPVSNNDVPADLLLRAGSRLQLRVNKNTPFYGDTGHGAYWIPAGSVSRIVFHK